MINKDTGILLNSFGIFYTTIAGANWVSSLFGFKYWGFSVPSSDTIFCTNFYEGNPMPVIQSNSRVYSSTNKGIVWSQLSYFQSIKFQEGFFINNTTGYFAGSESYYPTPLKIWKTTNSGVNITEMSTLPTNIYNYRDIWFKKVNTGYVLPFRTTNQGYNWSEIMPETCLQVCISIRCLPMEKELIQEKWC